MNPAASADHHSRWRQQIRRRPSFAGGPPSDQSRHQGQLPLGIQTVGQVLDGELVGRRGELQGRPHPDGQPELPATGTGEGTSRPPPQDVKAVPVLPAEIRLGWWRDPAAESRDPVDRHQLPVPRPRREHPSSVHPARGQRPSPPTSLRAAGPTRLTRRRRWHGEASTARQAGPPVRNATGEPSRAEPSRAEPSRAEPSRAEPSRAEPSRAEPSRAEPSRDAVGDGDRGDGGLLGGAGEALDRAPWR